MRAEPQLADSKIRRAPFELAQMPPILHSAVHPEVPPLMSITSLRCPAPIRRRLPVAPRDYDLRDRAITAFEQQDFASSIQLALQYLLPEISIPDLAAEPLLIVQGSARVRVHIDAGSLAISAVLAELQSGSAATAALRYYLTRLSATGQLFQPRLRGAVLSLEFRDQLGLMHPLKLIEVLQRLPMEADANDGWMVERFHVSTPDREPVATLAEPEFDQAWAIWNDHWSAMNELLLESRRRRSVRFLDTLGSLAANHIRYLLPLFGPVRADLNESAETFTDNEEHPNKRDSSLAKCIKSMSKVSQEQLRNCLGHASYAINPLQEGTPSLISSMLSGNRMQSTGELRSAGRSLEAALELISDYVYLLAYHSWPAEIESTLRTGLEQASDKPWREAADLLWNHANSTVRSHGNDLDPSVAEESAEYSYDA